MKINLKQLSKLEITDLGYIVFLFIFSLLALTELIKYLLTEYSFVRACMIFAGVTLLYVAQKNNLFGGGIQKTGTKRKKKESSELQETESKRKRVKKQVFSWISSQYLYLSFIMYAIFVIAYMFLDLSPQVFFYISLGFIVYYTIVRLSGQRVDMSLPETPFSQMTFFKLGVLSFSLFLVILFSLFPKELIGENTTLFYLSASFLYLSIFTFLFSRIFQNLFNSLKSRKFKLWIVSHTYFLLSGVIFLISFLLIAGKIGVFDSLFIQKIVPETYTPVVVEKIPEIEYQEVSEIRPLIEFYDIQAPLGLGDSGEEVTKLQNALNLIGNYTQEVTGVYDEYTRTTLRDVLIEKCDWPESTQGIVGPQAKACLDGIEVERKIRIDVSGLEGSIISDEAVAQ